MSTTTSEMVMVDEVPFPPQITSTTKPLSLLGHGNSIKSTLFTINARLWLI